MSQKGSIRKTQPLLLGGEAYPSSSVAACGFKWRSLVAVRLERQSCAKAVRLVKVRFGLRLPFAVPAVALAKDGYIDKDELYYVLDRVGTFKKAKWPLSQLTGSTRRIAGCADDVERR